MCRCPSTADPTTVWSSKLALSADASCAFFSVNSKRRFSMRLAFKVPLGFGSAGLSAKLYAYTPTDGAWPNVAAG